VTSAVYEIEDGWDFGVKGVMNLADKDHPYGFNNIKDAVEIPDVFLTDPDDVYGFDELSTFSAGLWASWYPVEGLRIQAAAGVNSLREGVGCFYGMLGATYNFNLKLW
ncbi:MAG: hypothetical protein IKR15_01305, partial [Bacteroidales bacterium]|nr:hypothetical protein [Bacteroidales bacterium]